MASELGLPQRVLVAVLIMASQGRVVLDESMVKWWFDALPKGYHNHKEFTPSDFSRLAIKCNWPA